MIQYARYLNWTPELVKRFWDWQSQFPETYFTYQYGAQIASYLMPNLRGRRSVLDYGCGMGFLLQHLVHYLTDVTACDVSEQSIRNVNDMFAALPNFRGAYAIHQLISEGRRFDVVIAVEVVEHLYDEQLDEMLDNVRRLLAPGGLAIFTTPNKEDLALNQVYCPQSQVVFHRWQHVRSWSDITLTGYLKSRGFCRTTSVTTNFAALPPRFSVDWGKWLVKRVLGLYAPNPHLVCIAYVD
jgi:2-polyprenyl-3-methyl-5-hydroxy-6-metoxy-1,4-benzoquinol methylase